MIFFDTNSEMLRQLTRIADAANAPHSSPWTDWLKTIASFIAGLLTAYVADRMKNRSSDKNDQSKMRRIVYYELGHCFLDLHGTICVETTLRKIRYTVFKDLCPFDGEAYMKEHPAIFYSLPEGQILTWLYYWFHRVDGGGLENPRKYGLAEMKAPLRFFSDCYRKYPVLKRNFKKVLSPEAFVVLDKAVGSYQSSATLEEMVDAGIIQVVERAPGVPEHGQSENL